MLSRVNWLTQLSWSLDLTSVGQIQIISGRSSWHQNTSYPWIQISWSFGSWWKQRLAFCRIMARCGKLWLSFRFPPSSGKFPHILFPYVPICTSHVFTPWVWKIAGEDGSNFTWATSGLCLNHLWICSLVTMGAKLDHQTATSFTANLAMWDHATLCLPRSYMKLDKVHWFFSTFATKVNQLLASNFSSFRTWKGKSSNQGIPNKGKWSIKFGGCLGVFQQIRDIQSLSGCKSMHPWYVRETSDGVNCGEPKKNKRCGFSSFARNDRPREACRRRCLFMKYVGMVDLSSDLWDKEQSFEDS